MDKRDFRQNCLTIRQEIKEKDRKSAIICEKLISLDIYKNSHVIAAYWAKDDEMNLQLFIERVIKDGKKIVLPRVVDDQLLFFQFHLNDQLEESKFHILEPLNKKQNYIDINNIDLFIVPGVAFDKNNNRLGYGKGYYDRVLKKTSSYKIGVAFYELIFKEIPHDENDIKMDVVIND